MRRLLPVLALLAATGAASAADVAKPKIVYKAPVAAAPVACALTQCNVWFVGPSIMGMGSNVDIIGQGISNSVFANGGYVAGDAGAQIWNSGLFLGVENMAGWAFGSPSTVSGNSVTTQGGLDILWFEAGGSLGDLFGSGAQPVPINTALSADLISLYFGTGPAQPFGNSSLGTSSFWTSGAGARYLLPTARPVMLDIKYIYGNNQNSTALASNKNVQLVGVSLLVPFNY